MTIPLIAQSADVTPQRTPQQELIKIAKSNNPTALYALGLSYEPNYQKAFPIIKKSALLKNTLAETKLGLYYLNGQGTKKDISLAKKYLELASNKGDPTALISLSLIDIQQSDYKSAIKLLTNPQLEENSTALEILGELYTSQFSDGKSHAKGLQYFTTSALFANPQAIEFLSVAYLNGKFTPKDYVKALTWINVLYYIGEIPKAQSLMQFLLPKMTKTQVQQAQIFSSKIIIQLNK